MARIRLGAFLSSVRGKLGNAVYAFNRYGPYVRNLSDVVNVLSPLQTGARDNFIAGSGVWPGLTSAQRLAWENYAKVIGINTAKGGYEYISANAMCTRINAARLGVGLPLVTDPPTNLNQPVIDTALAATLTASTTTLAVTYTPGAANMLLTTSKIAVYMAAPRAAGRKFNDGQFRYVGAIAGVTPAGTSPHNFTTLPFSVAVGQVCRVKFRTITLLEGVSEFHGEQDVTIA